MQIEELLESHDYKLKQSDLMAGALSDLSSKGLEYTMICWKGQGRSVIAAVEATRVLKLPSVAILGGADLLGISSNKESLLDAIKKGPPVVMILDTEERQLCSYVVESLLSHTVIAAATERKAIDAIKAETDMT